MDVSLAGMEIGGLALEDYLSDERGGLAGVADDARECCQAVTASTGAVRPAGAGSWSMVISRESLMARSAGGDGGRTASLIDTHSAKRI